MYAPPDKRNFALQRAQVCLTLCGHLAAIAHCMLNDPKKTELLKKEFSDKAGSVKCREIMKLKKLPCADCVDLAAQIVDKA